MSNQPTINMDGWIRKDGEWIHPDPLIGPVAETGQCTFAPAPESAETPTPETDAEAIDGNSNFVKRPDEVVSGEFSRKLERQRDAALARARVLETALEQRTSDANSEAQARDILRARVIELEDVLRICYAHASPAQPNIMKIIKEVSP